MGTYWLCFPEWVCAKSESISKNDKFVCIEVCCFSLHTALDALTHHYNDVIMDMLASQITSLSIVYSTVYSDADKKKHQSSASLAFVRRIHHWPVNSPHKWPVTRKMFPSDDVIMTPACTQMDQLYSLWNNPKGYFMYDFIFLWLIVNLFPI